MAVFGRPWSRRPSTSAAGQIAADRAGYDEGGIDASAAAARLLDHVPPTTRELRAQAVHRLQVGLFGLAGMLLLVSLANVIMDRAKYVDAAAINTAVPVIEPSATAAKDPLADMGVAPQLPVTAKENASAGKAAPAPIATPAAPQP